MPSGIRVPASISGLTSQAGGHRKGLKVLIYGPPKTGKSYFLAAFPKPILAAACGEAGIEPYLDPTVYDDKGNWVGGDLCINVNSAQEYEDFLDFGLSHTDKIKSIVFDNHNLLWGDFMDSMTDDLGVEEITGGLWRKVKGPWKAKLRRIMRASIHVGMSAWHRDLIYREKESPGRNIKAKLEILQQDNPDVEKNVPYVVDFILKADITRDNMFRPSGFHTITYYGGRRPKAVNPEDLFIGKVWKFNSKKPVESVWEAVVGPFFDKWNEGAVTHLGLDAAKVEEVKREVDRAWGDETVGRLLGRIETFEGDKASYHDLFREIVMEAKGLTESKLKLINEAHKKKKAEIDGR